MTTEERLAKIEKELAELRAELTECVRTRSVCIVDKSGQPRAVLGVDADRPRLGLAAGKASGGPLEAAVAALAERPTPAPERRQAAAAVAERRRPKVWVVLALTWGTLIPLILLWVFAVPADLKERLFNVFNAWLGGAP